jgi:hypothetical protein
LEHYSLLRFFHQSNKEKSVWYCWENSSDYAKKRSWDKVEDRDLAYKFYKRDDARRAANGACWNSLKEEGYKWEVIEVQEVRVTTQTFIESTVASNASALIQLARQAE